ncbi:hypothetical protein RDI58_018254 [Solanum bulbocastanum]|uniref:Uncharacterized protein n=1 Tax=Solanum bulbocastanum TaxID=147425 RepID=A0AAN8TB99_SOLBU
MRQLGKAEDRTCSSGGQGLAGQIPMLSPASHHKVQSLALSLTKPSTTWRWFLYLFLVRIWIILQVSDFRLSALPQKGVELLNILCALTSIH